MNQPKSAVSERPAQLLMAFGDANWEAIRSPTFQSLQKQLKVQPTKKMLVLLRKNSSLTKPHHLEIVRLHKVHELLTEVAAR